jgi:hypothetical protein
MLMQAFLLLPYVAIAASLTLVGTITMVCISQPTPRRVGFSA